MAREDTRWFVAGVVVLSIVLFFALPLSVLVVVDYLKLKAEIKAERKIETKELKRLQAEVKAATEALRKSQGD